MTLSPRDVTEGEDVEVALQRATAELEVTAEELRQQNDELLNAQRSLYESQERYRMSEERFRLAQDVANIGTFDWDLFSGVPIWTPKMEAMHGFPPGGFIQMLIDGGLAWTLTPAENQAHSEEERAKIGELLAERVIHPEDRDKFVHLFLQALETGAPTEGEWRVVWPDGSIHWHTERFQFIKDASVRPRRLLGVAIDITERKQAENALLLSEERFRLAQEVANIGTFDWDFQSGVPIWTLKMEAMHGLPPGGFVKMLIDGGLAWTLNPLENQAHSGGDQSKIIPLLAERVIHPDDRAKFIRLLSQAAETGAPTEGEWRVVWPNGSIHWHSQRFQFFKDALGKPLRLLGVAIDITELKQAEKALKESEERFRLAQEIANIGTFDWDITSGALVWTPKMEAMHGLPPGGFAKMLIDGGFAWALNPAENQAHSDEERTKILSLLAEKVIYPEDRDKFVQLFLRALETGAPTEDEWRVVWPDGSIHWHADRFQLFKDESGKLRRLLGAAIDITGRKQAEKALQESEERFRLAQDAADVGVFDWNIQTGEIVWTPRFEAMYGLPPGGLAEKLTVVDNKLYLKDPLEISKLAEKLVHPEDKAKVSHLIEEAFMSGEPVDGQWRLVWPDGSIHWQSFRIQLFKDELGKPKRLTGISIDITESELAEEEQRRNSENMMMLIHESPTPIIFVNSEGNMIIINRMAENLLGYGPGELLGYPLSTILRPGSSLKVEDRKNYPVRIVNKLGTEIPSAISTSVQPFKDKKSGIQERGMIVILKDLSELHGLSIAPTREVEVTVEAEDAKPVLELGYIYLVEEDHPSRSLAILKEMMEHGAQGLYISREKPERIRNTYHLEKTPFIWLTRNKVPGENCIAPDELTKLNKTAENFIEKADQGILFFDGLEYLIAQNGFNIVLQFFYSLNDAISLHNSLAIFVIDPLAFEPRELHILRRESRSLQA